MNELNTANTIIHALRSVPDRLRACILYAMLVDPEHAADMLMLDERISRQTVVVIRELKEIDVRIRNLLLISLLNDALCVLDEYTERKY
jgi:hypothetical protein